MVTAAMKLKTFAPWKKRYDKPRQCIRKQRHHFADKGPYSQSYGFSSNHVWMWELDHKEAWAMKSWCFWIVMLEKTLESPLDCKKIKPVNPKGNQPWIFTGRTLKLGKIENGGVFYRKFSLLSQVEVKWKSLSHVRLFVTPWTIQSMEFSRPEYWSG